MARTEWNTVLNLGFFGDCDAVITFEIEHLSGFGRQANISVRLIQLNVWSGKSQKYIDMTAMLTRPDIMDFEQTFLTEYYNGDDSTDLWRESAGE